LPYTIGDYLADDIRTGPIPTDTPEFDEAENHVKDRLNKLLSIQGTKSVDSFHKKLGRIMWNQCGMSRNAEGLKQAIQDIKALKEEFWRDVRVTGELNEFNAELEKAGRVADFLELGILMCQDALDRNESCGGHFREEYQTPEGEALRDDENYKFVSAYEYTGEDGAAVLHKEELTYEAIELKTRSYK
jgi:succinate dehydrogenase / fumarate reductase flavoprotein subunit